MMTGRINGNRSTFTPCFECPLLANEHYRKFKDRELNFMDRFKTGELTVDAGTGILVEGAHSPHMFTVLSGWTFRHRSLSDGRRQVLNYGMPGDLLGLQSTMMGEMMHSVEALTRVTLCVFEKDRFAELYKAHPGLAFDTTWLAAREERMLEEHLLSVGQRTALERAAYLLAFLYKRALATRLIQSRSDLIPFTQHHAADTLGLSLVHTNKTLKKLAQRGLMKWREGGCEVLDVDGLCDVAGWNGEISDGRPFL